MTKEDLERYEQKLALLSDKENKLRNIYLKKLQTGEILGPTTGYKSIDKPWLKHYTDEGIMVEYPKLTMYEYMMNKNRHHMLGTALRYFGRNISFLEFDKEINKAVKNFKKLGVKKGDRVTIIMPNTPEAVISVYALNKMGAVAAMMHPKSAEDEIKDFVNMVKSNVVIVLDKFADKVEKIEKDTCIKHTVVVQPEDSMPLIVKKIYERDYKQTHYKPDGDKHINWNQFKNLSKDDHSKVIGESYEKDRLAVILRTGGSTGTPKGVSLSDDNFNTMVEQFFQSEDNFKRGDKLLALMPVFHGFGLCSSIHLPLSVGVSINLIPELQKKDLGKIMRTENHLIGVPTFLDAILKNPETLKIRNLRHLKYVVSGGDSDTDKTESDFNDYLAKRHSNVKQCKGYGLAETVAGATFACGKYNAIGSIGIPMVDTVIKLVDPVTGLEVTEDNQVGEIVIKGPTVMMGYYNNDEETKEALRDGWLYTGDMAAWENGLLYFKQRKGDMIINSGINVYPREIERVLIEHPAIESVTVVGAHHSYKKEVPKAYIKLKDGYEYSESLIDEFKELCKKKLNIYSNPYYYEIIDAIPQTLLGKVNRKELKNKEEKELTLKK